MSADQNTRLAAADALVAAMRALNAHKEQGPERDQPAPGTGAYPDEPWSSPESYQRHRTEEARLHRRVSELLAAYPNVPAPPFRPEAEMVEALRKALTQIAKGEGRFSRDPYEHACNTIEDMKELARAALDGGPDAQR